MQYYSQDTNLWLYLSPILIFIGIIEGVLCLVILTRKRFRDLPVFVTLITLATVDILVFVTCLGPKWIGTIIDFELNQLNNVSCKLLTWFTLSFTHISSMLVALLSIERLVAVTGLVKNASQKIDRFGVPIILTLGFLINLIPVSFTELVPDPNIKNLSKYDIPGFHQNKHVFQCTQKDVKIATIIDILDACFLAIIPSIIILISNFFIIRMVRRKAEAVYKNKLRSNSVHSELDKQKKKLRSRDTRITNTLLTVTFTFCICNLPFALTNIIRTARFMNDDLLPDLLWVMTMFLTYVNNLANFIIYCVIQPALRDELYKLFCCPAIIKLKPMKKDNDHEHHKTYETEDSRLAETTKNQIRQCDSIYASEQWKMNQ